MSHQARSFGVRGDRIQTAEQEDVRERRADAKKGSRGRSGMMWESWMGADLQSDSDNVSKLLLPLERFERQAEQHGVYACNTGQ